MGPKRPGPKRLGSKRPGPKCLKKWAETEMGRNGIGSKRPESIVTYQKRPDTASITFFLIIELT